MQASQCRDSFGAMRGSSLGWGLGALTLVFGCTRDPIGRAPNQASPAPTSTAAAATVPSSASAGAAASAAVTPSAVTPGAVTPSAVTPAAASRLTNEPELAVFDHAVLQTLQRSGFDFATTALGLASSAAASNSTLASDAGYASIVSVLSKDLDELLHTDRAAGVGMKYAHRVFDKRWLTNPHFHFDLVGVVNRVDRRAFAPNTCGELRFIYRLAYATEVKGQRVASRLPMTVNVVRWINASCERWVSAMQQTSRDGAELAAAHWTASGAPLSPESWALTSPKSVEVNLQSVRWPSTVRPALGGHAEYLLRVFRREAATGAFAPSPLENTPDVVRLERDAAALQRLSKWLQAPEQAEAIRLGTLRVPDEFLATRAHSVAPHGLARRGNRPFTAALGTLWRDIPAATATLRRLDGASCPGCHQSRSIAGFHVLGNEAPDKHLDALALPHSAHFTDDMARRRAYVRALASGTTPDEYRAPAEHPDGPGGWGSRCGLDVSPGAPFAGWTCGTGLRCEQVDDTAVGECLPAEVGVGDACESGAMTWSTSGRDSIRAGASKACAAGAYCERSAVGFPGGMCSSGCGNPEDEHAVCGGIAILDSFNACIARGEVFETCLATTTRPGALRRCSHESPCRDDYVCAATEAGSGACLPPYFLFQLRVDGHVF